MLPATINVTMAWWSEALSKKREAGSVAEPELMICVGDVGLGLSHSEEDGERRTDLQVLRRYRGAKVDWNENGEITEAQIGVVFGTMRV